MYFMPERHASVGPRGFKKECGSASVERVAWEPTGYDFATYCGEKAFARSQHPLSMRIRVAHLLRTDSAMHDRVLIVDDEQDECDQLARLTRRLDYEPICTTSPEAALDLIGKEPVSAISPISACPRWEAWSSAPASWARDPTFLSSS